MNPILMNNPTIDVTYTFVQTDLQVVRDSHSSGLVARLVVHSVPARIILVTARLILRRLVFLECHFTVVPRQVKVTSSEICNVEIP